MKSPHLFTLLLLTSRLGFSQVDPTKMPVVYQAPGMDKVSVQKGIVYKTVNDTTLTFDIYYPLKAAGESESLPPVVIFNNGVGSLELPTWKVYADWAKLSAVNGMIAINHQSRSGKSFRDSEDLIDYLQLHAAALKLDRNRMAIWACSGNVGVGMPLAMQPNRKYIRALVIYYGAGWRPEDNVIKRQDLEIQLVRAGLDFYNLNKNFETLMQSALETDAHVEFINYPEGQHAFDVVDNTERSKEIVQQTLEFLKRKLAPNYPVAEPFVLTNRLLWHMIVDGKKTDEALAEFRKAIEKYRKMPNHSPWYNHIIDERNLNQLGYQLLQGDRIDDAIKVFTSNQAAFPDSPNVYDALGDAYEKSGDKAKAVANATRALELLEKANIQPQFRDAIRASAEGKIKRLKQ